MKKWLFLSLCSALLLGACASVSVKSDYDHTVAFTQYRSFAFAKSGIDAAQISDLDKKRIMRAIESELVAKGMTISENPDLLVSFFTQATKEVNVSPNYHFGWGWGPVYMNNAYTSTNIKGQLFVEFIDAKNKQLVWQGEGRGGIDYEGEKREERVKEFVQRILSQYPPTTK